ncbi:MalM family protein [Oleiphilus messinensis]|nr:MalM family protein [Oleiphilus messinensis]
MRFLILIMLSVSLPVNAAEKYRTWIDSDGNVQMQKIQEERNPFLPEGVTFEPEDVVRKNNNQAATGKSDAEVNSGESARTPSADPVKSDTIVNKPLPGLANPENTSSGDAPRIRSDLDITVVDESEFVDGDELARRGYIRDENEVPTYVWRDAEGRLQNSPYVPNPDQKQSNGSQASVSEELVTPAIQYFVVPGYDAVVAQGASHFSPDMLKVGDFVTFQKQCCESLDKEYIQSLSSEREILVEIDDRSNDFNFPSGQSRYELVKIDEAGLNTNPLVRMRTFDQKGLFYPTIIMLGRSFEPLRMIVYPKLDYHPETWNRYGYMESLFKVNYMNGEKYILVFSRRNEQIYNEAVPDKKGRQKQLALTDQGEFEFKLLK